MKKKYITPASEQISTQLQRALLENSLVDSYTGEDAIPADGEW